MGIILVNLAASSHALAAGQTMPQISDLVRQELLLPGSTYTNTADSQIYYSTLAGDGGVVVCGSFKGTKTFGKSKIVSHKVAHANPQYWYKDLDVFVAKADLSGKWAWAARVSATGGASCRTISMRPDGSYRVRINYEGTAAAASKTLAGSGAGDFFVSKSGKPLALATAEPEPKDMTGKTNAYSYSPLEASPAFVGFQTSSWTTTWNIQGSQTEVDLNDSHGGLLGKKVGSTWAWVEATPGDTEIMPDFQSVPTADGGVVVALSRYAGSSLAYAGFNATTGLNSLAKFDSKGQPVWGFEIPEREISAYAELPNNQFIVSQGIEGFFEVSDFKLQVYSQNGKANQTLKLSNLVFPPRHIFVVSQNRIWLQTNNSVILLKPKNTKSTIFKNCVSVNAKYVGGIASSSKAKNKGKLTHYKPFVSATIYSLNKELDADHDQIICER